MGGMRLAQTLLPIAVEVPDPAVALLRPAGELDMLTAPELRDALTVRLRRHRHVVVDLRDVSFLGSSGVQVLAEAHQLARDNGRSLHVTGAGQRRIARPLQITGLDTILAISDECPGALAARLSGAGEP